MNKIVKNVLTAVSLTALTATGLTAANAKTDEYLASSVGYADLDLTTSKGQARLKSRIKTAVRNVCGQHAGLGFGAIKKHKQCMSDAHDSVQQDVVAVVANAKSDQMAFATINQ